MEWLELVSQVNGQLRCDLEENKWQVKAAYDIDHFKYLHRQVSNMRGDLTYDPNTRYLESREFIADFYAPVAIWLIFQRSPSLTISTQRRLSPFPQP